MIAMPLRELPPYSSHESLSSSGARTLRRTMPRIRSGKGAAAGPTSNLSETFLEIKSWWALLA